MGSRNIAAAEISAQPTVPDSAAIQHANAMKIEQFKAVVQSGQNAIKGLFVINGGAAGALLAFIGNLATNQPENVPLLAVSLTIFVVGLAFAGMAAGAVYFADWSYTYRKTTRRGPIFNAFAGALGILSLVLFFWGIQATYTAFAAFKPSPETSNSKTMATQKCGSQDNTTGENIRQSTTKKPNNGAASKP